MNTDLDVVLRGPRAEIQHALIAATASIEALTQENERLKRLPERCQSCDDDELYMWSKRATEAEAALTESRADVARLTAERAWQPIETAPKDGTWIMVINAEAKEPKPWFARMKRGWWVNQRNFTVDGSPFTHWMLLPDAPQPAGEIT